MAAAAASSSRSSRETSSTITQDLINSFKEENYHFTPGSIAKKGGAQTSSICLARLKSTVDAFEPAREDSPIEKAHNVVLKFFETTDFRKVSDIRSGWCRSEAYAFKLSPNRVTKLNAVIGYDEIAKSIMRYTNLEDVRNPEETTIIGSETKRGPDLDLFEAIDIGTSFSSREIIETLEQLLNTLKKIQDDGFFYRDLKPENILYRPGGIEICDLGYLIPKNPPEDERAAILHRKNLFKIMGTLIYVAPEALISKKTWNDKTDAYSAALVVLLMLFKTPLLNFDSRTNPSYLPLLRNWVYTKYEEQRELPLEMRDLFGYTYTPRRHPTGTPCGRAIIEESHLRYGKKIVPYSMTKTSFESFEYEVVRRGGLLKDAKILYSVLLGLLDHNQDTRLSIDEALALLSHTTHKKPGFSRSISGLGDLAAPAAAKPPAAPAAAAMREDSFSEVTRNLNSAIARLC
jgi:serine/threonine protein kinase